MYIYNIGVYDIYQSLSLYIYIYIYMFDLRKEPLEWAAEELRARRRGWAQETIILYYIVYALS